MIVVDTNVIAYLYVPSALTPLAQELERRDPRWVSPLIWRSEFMNVLIGYVRRGQLTLAEAQALIRDATRQLGDSSPEALPSEVLALAHASACSCYDCEFVALAQRLGVPLVTADRQVLAAFPGTAQSMADFLKG